MQNLFLQEKLANTVNKAGAIPALSSGDTGCTPAVPRQSRHPWWQNTVTGAPVDRRCRSGPGPAAGTLATIASMLPRSNGVAAAGAGCSGAGAVVLVYLLSTRETA